MEILCHAAMFDDSVCSSEQIFSHMNAVLSPQGSCLTPEHSKNCVKHKITTYVAGIQKMAETMQRQGFH